MFPNLRAEMARYRITIKDVAESLGLSRKSVSDKMAGWHKGFTLDEAIKIRDRFFPESRLDELFAKMNQEAK